MGLKLTHRADGMLLVRLCFKGHEKDKVETKVANGWVAENELFHSKSVLEECHDSLRKNM